MRGYADCRQPQHPRGTAITASPAAPPPPLQPAVSAVSALQSVLRVRPFRRLWYFTALSSLGDWLGLLATTAMATSLTDSYQARSYALGGVLVVRLAPAVVLGPLAGLFADRFDRRLTMVVSDMVRFVLFLSIPLAHLVVDRNQTLAWLFIATFAIECVSLFWIPAKEASVPNLVRRDQVEAANQLGLITTYGITPVLGAALFSVLSLITNVLARHLEFFRTQPVNLALYFNAATFLLGAIVVYFIKEITGRRESRPQGDDARMGALLREGVAFIRSSRLVGGLMVGLMGAFVAAGAVIGAGKLWVTSLGGGDAAYGVLFGSVFVGLGLGIALGPRLAREMSRRRLFGLSIVFSAVCLVVAAIMPQIALAVALVVGVGFGAGIAYLAGSTLIGTDVADDVRGRVFALLQSLIRIMLVASLAAVPFIVGGVGKNTFGVFGTSLTVDGTRFVLVAGGLLALLAGVLAYRKMDEREQTPLWADIKESLRGEAVARRRVRQGSLFVAFEGGEGAGKSTQVQLLATALREAGRAVTVTHEPGATEVGAKIRAVLLHGSEPVAARAEALLFAADRAQHIDSVIRPALEANQVVITDRFVDSSLAYQGAGRRLSMETVRRLSRWATEGLRPDLTVLLDLPAEEGLRRAGNRGGSDRLERESLEFHERVRMSFRSIAESAPRRYLVIDATAPADQIAAQVLTAVEAMLHPKRVALRPNVPVSAGG